MLNIIWSVILFSSLIYGILNGTFTHMTEGIFNASLHSVELTIKLTASVCFWSGIMKIASDSKFTSVISFFLRPLIRLLFPKLNPKGKAAEAIIMNMTANFFGLGNAATPLGLTAMQELDKENHFSQTASNEMCTFVILNTASFQLLPTTIMGLRAAYNSSDPSSIIIPVWITSFITLFSALLLSGFFFRRFDYE